MVCHADVICEKSGQHRRILNFEHPADFDTALELQADGWAIYATDVESPIGGVQYHRVLLTPETKNTIRRMDTGTATGGECFGWAFTVPYPEGVVTP